MLVKFIWCLWACYSCTSLWKHDISKLIRVWLNRPYFCWYFADWEHYNYRWLMTSWIMEIKEECEKKGFLNCQASRLLSGYGLRFSYCWQNWVLLENYSSSCWSIFAMSLVHAFCASINQRRFFNSICEIEDSNECSIGSAYGWKINEEHIESDLVCLIARSPQKLTNSKWILD